MAEYWFWFKICDGLVDTKLDIATNVIIGYDVFSALCICVISGCGVLYLCSNRLSIGTFYEYRLADMA